uniref:Ubiquitin-like domain-containing protein n=1 Tax=Crocodylus porosus TaxID=8502 RepID=A0A7M4EQU9_CROPO
MKLSLKNQTLSAISLKVEPKDNTWNAKANIQIKTDTLEDSELDEQRFIFTCKQLNGTCTLISYNIQNEPSFQQLQLMVSLRGPCLGWSLSTSLSMIWIWG